MAASIFLNYVFMRIQNIKIPLLPFISSAVQFHIVIWFVAIFAVELGNYIQHCGFERNVENAADDAETAGTASCEKFYKRVQ
jgi:hypothetical protein